jgi:hypothetical protein
MCGCGGARTEALTTNQAQALIDAANAEVALARQTELEAMVASIATASQNANSGASAQR